MEVKFPKDKYLLSDISINQLQKRIEEYPQDDLWLTFDAAYILRMLKEIAGLRVIMRDAYKALGGHCNCLDLPFELPKRITELVLKYNAEVTQNSNNTQEIYFLKDRLAVRRKSIMDLFVKCAGFAKQAFEEQKQLREVKMSEEYQQNFNSKGLELIKSICDADDGSMFSKTIKPDIVMSLVKDLENARKRIAELLEVMPDVDKDNS